MTDQGKEWGELFQGLREATQPLAAPKCPRSQLPEWLGEQTEDDGVETQEALMHWLQHWEWPEMSEEARGLAWLMMCFAWSGLVDGMERGWVCPSLEAQRRGVIYGLLFRNWPLAGERWVLEFSRSAKQAADGSFLN